MISLGIVDGDLLGGVATDAEMALVTLGIVSLLLSSLSSNVFEFDLPASARDLDLGLSNETVRFLLCGLRDLAISSPASCPDNPDASLSNRLRSSLRFLRMSIFQSKHDEA